MGEEDHISIDAYNQSVGLIIPMQYYTSFNIMYPQNQDFYVCMCVCD